MGHIVEDTSTCFVALKRRAFRRSSALTAARAGADRTATSPTALAVTASTARGWLNEAAEARIWAGIHYRFDIEAGELVGGTVAEKVLAPGPVRPRAVRSSKGLQWPTSPGNRISAPSAMPCESN
jgi:hypothetical protein